MRVRRHVVAIRPAKYLFPSIIDSTISESSVTRKRYFVSSFGALTYDYRNLGVMVPFLTSVIQVGATTYDPSIINDH